MGVNTTAPVFLGAKLRIMPGLRSFSNSRWDRAKVVRALSLLLRKITKPKDDLRIDFRLEPAANKLAADSDSCIIHFCADTLQRVWAFGKRLSFPVRGKAVGVPWRRGDRRLGWVFIASMMRDTTVG